MTAPRHPSPQGISALLAKAGFKRAERDKAMAYGWPRSGCTRWTTMSDGEAVSEFPASAADVNWELLKIFYEKPHPLVNNEMDTTGLHFGIVELLDEAKAVHHLLDLAGVPHGFGMDTRSIDARTLVMVIAMGNLRERLARISDRHARETGPAGTVGDFCIECGHRWPCGSRRLADGTCLDEEDGTDGF